VRHCLEKNPEERFHSAHDLAFDLESLSGASAPRPTVDTRTSPLRVGRVPLLIGAVLAIAGMAATYWLGKRAGEVQPAKFHQLTFRRGTIASHASPRTARRSSTRRAGTATRSRCSSRASTARSRVRSA
jgi:hypothetical protein